MLETVPVFASLVGLLSTYTAERREGGKQTLADFREWLRRHEHQEVLEYLYENAQARDSLEKFLANQHEDVIDRLTQMNGLLVLIAETVSGLGAVSRAMPAGEQLSEQQRTILREMNRAQSSTILYVVMEGDCGLTLLDGRIGQVEITDKRFIETDMDQLVSLGMLKGGRQDTGGGGTFTITRLGATVGDV